MGIASGAYICLTFILAVLPFAGDCGAPMRGLGIPYASIRRLSPQTSTGVGWWAAEPPSVLPASINKTVTG
jgi:hypothetical protein